MSNRETIEAGIAAMLDGNRVKFAAAMDDVMSDKVSELVDARREELSKNVFDFSESDETEDDEDFEIEEIEETEAE